MISQKDMFVKNFISECIIVEPPTPVSRVIGLMRKEDVYQIFP
ncbi:MAG: hypothetical protein QXH24_06150 [Candidatus Bathyarchaeia archaeon]